MGRAVVNQQDYMGTGAPDPGAVMPPGVAPPNQGTRVQQDPNGPAYAPPSADRTEARYHAGTSPGYTRPGTPPPTDPNMRDHRLTNPIGNTFNIRRHNADGSVDFLDINGNVAPRQPTVTPPPLLAIPGTPVDPTAYALPGAEGLNQSLAARAAAVAGRQAPTMPGAAQVAPTQFAPAATAAGAQLGPAQQAAAAQLGAAAQAGPANFGAAGYAGNVTISPAQQALAAQLAPMQQAQDSSFRGGQQANIDQLNRYATGQESVSQLQLKQNNEQLMAQQLAMAQSGRPGDVAMNARAAAQNMGTLGAGLAGQQALAGLQERQANAGLLATTLQGARAQDIGLNQFNVGQTNQGALAQAGFQQGANLQNAQQSNQQAIAQGQLTGQIGMTNAGLSNAMGIAQGQTGAQIGMFNAGQSNTQAQTQAQLQSQTALANMQSANQYNLAGAQLGQQASQFNAGQQQQMALAQGQSQAAAAAQQAQLSQQAGQFGVTAGLQFQGQQDMAQQSALAQQLALAGQMQTGNIAGQTAIQQQTQQQQILAQQQKLAQLAAQTQLQVQDKNMPSWFQQYAIPAAAAGAAVIAAL